MREQWCQFPDRGFGVGFDIEAQLGGEAHGAEHAHRVFPVAGFRVANQPHLAVFQIVNAVGEIHHGEVADAVIEGVYGEISAQGVFFQIAVDVIPQQQAVLAGSAVIVVVIFLRFCRISAKGGDLNDFPAEQDVNNAEAPANQPGVAEQVMHLFRRGVGGDIKILGFAAKQYVSNTTAHQIRFVTGIVQPAEHFLGGLADE